MPSVKCVNILMTAKTGGKGNLYVYESLVVSEKSILVTMYVYVMDLDTVILATILVTEPGAIVPGWR